MRLIFFLFLFSTGFGSLVAQASDWHVDYAYQYTKTNYTEYFNRLISEGRDSAFATSLVEKVRLREADILEDSKVEFFMQIKKDMSQFFWNENQRTPIPNDWQSKKKVHYFCNAEKQAFYSNKTGKGVKFAVTTPFSYYDWIILDDSREILGYTAQKAIWIEREESSSGKILEIPHIAWFTKEIPHSAGPNGFGGLPGLILELKAGKSTYWRATKITPMEQKTIEYKEEGKPIDIYAWNKLWERR